jgi:serine/threonine protein kinase
MKLVLSVLSAVVWTSQSATASQASGSILSTDCLGDLKLLTGLGKGRNSLVFKAQQINGAEKIYAVKTSEVADELARESEVLQALNDEPGFPKFFCSGPGFLVMEFMEGFKSLDKLMKEQEPLPLPIEEIAVSLLDRLEAVHRAGFVHVDVHKRNIMVNPSGDVVLLDFGLAIPISEHKKPAMNLFYSSIHEQIRQPLHPIDDVERLVYVCLQYSYGPLPWSSFVGMHEGLEREAEATKGVLSVLKRLEERVFELKQALLFGEDAEYFESNKVSSGFRKMLHYIKEMMPVRNSLSFSVDYAYLRGVLREGREPGLPIREVATARIGESHGQPKPSLLPTKDP